MATTYAGGEVLKKDRHIMEALGRTKVVIENGRVIEVGRPMIKSCRLFQKTRGMEKITPEAVKANIEFRIKEIGMCTNKRTFKIPPFVDFGVSEILMSVMSKGLLDCAVLACDGAGTVIVTDPDLAQGVGGRLSGLIETSPLKDILEELIKRGAIPIDPNGATIDQVTGTEKAIEFGYKRVGVTVTSAKDAEEIRRLEAERGADITIFAVHLSGLTKEEIKGLTGTADVITACASKWTRKLAGEKALIQAGVSVPMFALTQKGKKFLLERAMEVQRPIIVRANELPYLPEDEQPKPLI